MFDMIRWLQVDWAFKLSQFRLKFNWKMFLFRFFSLTFLDSQSDGIKYHRKFRFVNFSWMCIHLTVFIYLIVSPSSSIFTRNYSRMSEVIEIGNYIFALATILVILIHVQMVKEKDVIWHKKLHRLDQLLADKFSVKINHRVIGRWKFWKVLITFSTASICSAVNIFYATHNNDSFILLLFIHNYFLKTIINLRYIQNFIRMDSMRHHIEAVHEAVCNVVEHNTVEWNIVLMVNKNQKWHSSKRKIDDVDDILLFKRFYATLFETMKILENCFGWSMLTMILFTFVDLTSNLYWFFIAILGLDTRIQLVDSVLEIIPSVVSISCLFYSSFDSNRKAKELISSVPKLYTNTTSCYNKMIKEFLMQIHHERIENSANDFFIVDFKLFSAVSFNMKFEKWLISSGFYASRAAVLWRVSLSARNQFIFLSVFIFIRHFFSFIPFQMLNAIVTYMLILIQFAVSERKQQWILCRVSTEEDIRCSDIIYDRQEFYST